MSSPQRIHRRQCKVPGVGTVRYTYHLGTREIQITSIPGFEPWTAEFYANAPDEVRDVVGRNPHKL